MSFLDVICCGFGAMVMLVLLAKTDVADGLLNSNRAENLINAIAAEKKRKTEHINTRDKLLTETKNLTQQLSETETSKTDVAGLQQRINEAQAKAKILEIKNEVGGKRNAGGGDHR